MTAVEWLVEEMIKKGFFDANKPLTFTNLEHLQNQAKEMEKQQIFDAYEDGYSDSDNTFELNKEYYNEKFQNK